MSLLVNLVNLSKTYYRGDASYRVLRDVDLELRQGELVAIVGASGSGKSTLMNILGFLDQASSGEYFFNGENVSHLADDQLAVIRNRKIGFVFQAFFLLHRLTVLQNVMLPLFYRDEDMLQAKHQAQLVLEKVGMERFADHTPQQLSGGQQQRVAIARALVGDPEIILADEPTGSLDSQTGQDVMNLFLKLNNVEKRTIIIVTHDENISRQCQRVVTLKDGCIVQDKVAACV